jgi:predicted RND superfamily exporter protein
VVTVIGIGKVRVETSFLNNFRPGSSVVQAYQGVETQFGGAGVWDVVLDAPTELNADYLQQVRKLEADLREIEVDGARLTKVLSLADAEEIASRAPLSSLFSPSSRLSAMYLVMPTFFDALLTSPRSGGRKLRIMLRSREQLDSQQKLALIREVQRRVQDHTSSDQWKAAAGKTSSPRVTGYYVLMARLVSQLLGDQWRCFLASGMFVWWLLAFATRSLRLATAALLPNLLPIFLVLALVGIFGGKINMGAAMIAAVSIGLSIDGSVHFLAGYRRSRDRGHDSLCSAIHAAGNIGVPVLLATVALVVGFGVMSTSDFIPTATFGTLVAATLALGTLVNLTLLPAMVAGVDR